MKKIIYFTVLLFLVLMPNNIVKADCSDSEIVRLQRIANNVNYSVLYNEKTNQFTIYFSNLKKDLILNDTYTKKNYNLDGEVSIIRNASGDYKFNIYANDKECTENILISKYINVPYYNGYYNSDICKGIENYGYCAKWFKTGISNETITKNINDYRKKISVEITEKKKIETNIDRLKKIIVELYVKYYYIILPSVILILGIIIYKNNKKNSLV